MAGKEALLERLRRDAPGVKSVNEHLADRMNKWLADVQALMDQITDWLSDAVDQGLLKIEPVDVELAEEDLGPYVASGLSIHVRTAHPRTIKVLPRGMRVAGLITGGRRIVGAEGRVDLACGAGRMILLRTPDPNQLWRIVLSDGGTAALTEDAFSEALNELLE